MLSRHVIAEPADLLLLSAQQPTLALFWRVSINKWSVLVRHGWSLAKPSAHQAKDRLLKRQSVDPRENWIQLAFCIQKRPSQGRPQSTPGIENPVIALKTLATTGLEIAF